MAPYPAEVVERYRARYRELTGDSTSFFSVTVNRENLLPEERFRVPYGDYTFRFLLRPTIK